MSEPNSAIRAFCLSMFGAMLFLAIKEVYFALRVVEECGAAPEEPLDKTSGLAMGRAEGRRLDAVREEEMSVAEGAELQIVDGVVLGPCAVGVCPRLRGCSPDEEGAGAESAEPGEDEEVTPETSPVEESAEPDSKEFAPCEASVCPFGSPEEEIVGPRTLEATPCADGVCVHDAQITTCEENVCPHRAEAPLCEESPGAELPPCDESVCPFRFESCPAEETLEAISPCEGGVCAVDAEITICEDSVCPLETETPPCEEDVCQQRKKLPSSEESPKELSPCDEAVCPFAAELRPVEAGESPHAAKTSPCEDVCQDDPQLTQCQDNVCPHVPRPTQLSPGTNPKE